MTQNFRDIAGEVAAEIYNHKLPPTAEEFLDLLEPISEKIFDLLPCFSSCNSLDEVFSLLSAQFKNDNIHSLDIFNRIEDFGYVGVYYNPESDESSIQPDWFVVGIQTEAPKYHRYFNSFQDAVGCVVQASLINQMIQIFDWENTDHDWRSLIERQLAISLAVVQWYGLTGDLDQCAEVLLKTFRMEGLEDFTTTGSFMLDYVTDDRNNLQKVYYSRFQGSPDHRDFNKPAKWKWYIEYLPE